MQNLTNLRDLRDILHRHNFHNSKSLGQNFLINPSVPARMADCCRGDVGVLEIGPGIGVLTRELCAVAKKVVAVELDQRLLPILSETLSGHDNLTVLHGDILKLDLHKLLREEFGEMPVMVCANLPYYITSPIIMKLLEEQLPITSIIVMVQREVAQRICKEPPHRDCSAISYGVWYRAAPSHLFTVSAGSFYPPPKVDSAVMRLDLLPTPAVTPNRPDVMFHLVRAAFSQRRKTIQNAVPSGFPITKEAFSEALRQANLAPNLRAEQLSLSDFARLADLVGEAPSITEGGPIDL